MKHYNNMKNLVVAVLTVAALQTMAALSTGAKVQPQNSAPKEVKSAAADTLDPQLRPTPVRMRLLARSYGDSVVLRWAIDGFPEWRYLTQTGVNVFRYEPSAGLEIDTIAFQLKPLSREQMRQRYSQTDSVALLAMGSLYGTGSLTADMTPWTPGSMGAFVDIEQDQKMRLATAFLVSEWRSDLADALGLRIVDRTAKKGHTYTYIIRPAVEDTTGFFLIESDRIMALKNEKYRPEPYAVTLSDSVVGHGQVVLRWNDQKNGSFEIYRRRKGEKEWTHVNERPYLPPYKFEPQNEDAIFSNSVPELGTYEYAVQAHDAFGDLTEMSAPHAVTFRDLQAPMPPRITQIVIERPNRQDPSAEVWANIYFSKDTMENDFVRYVPMYYNERDSLKSWRLLSEKYVAPEDTMMRIDVTHVSTGMMTIAAVDTAGNMGYAMPTLLRVADLNPPKAPVNLTAITKITGEILLLWDMPDSVAVQHYEVFYANDLSHHFVSASENEMITSRAWQDTISTNANQRYIYYTVRARDFARNIGPFSDTIRVLRPNPNPPTAAHLDSTYTSRREVYMRWAVGGEEYIARHYLKRKMESEPDDRWTTLAVFDGDSVAAAGYYLTYTDRPAINRNDRYEYMVETVSFWDISSGPSASLLARVRGDNYIEGLGLKAFATYDSRNKQVRLTWEHAAVPDGAPYYYCIYRKEGDGADFRYVINVDSSERLFTDRLFAGETNEYYVTIRLKDGRGTTPSNTVKVTAPKPKDADNN